MRRNIKFWSLLCKGSRIITDIDGNIYHSVIINNKEWLVENLRTEHYADGSAIPIVTANGGSVIYSDWFLPSKDELIAMYTELDMYGIGNFNHQYYWSSSESPLWGPLYPFWCLSFGVGFVWRAIKTSEYAVRPCRSFTTTNIYALRDPGPAGGWIFHIINNGGGSYTYYEAAPYDADDPDESIGYIGANYIDEIGVTAQGTAIGTGITNTPAIIAHAGHTDSAAKLCTDFVVSTGSGWIDDTIGAMCYYNNDEVTYKAAYGALYNGYAIENVAELIYIKRGGVEESGWRIPTQTDLETLRDYLGGYLYAGTHLKASGTVLWTAPNSSADNSSGFTGVGAGTRSSHDGTFTYMGAQMKVISSSEISSTLLSSLTLYANYSLDPPDSSRAYVGNFHKASGGSIRLMRDV